MFALNQLNFPNFIHRWAYNNGYNMQSLVRVLLNLCRIYFSVTYEFQLLFYRGVTFTPRFKFEAPLDIFKPTIGSGFYEQHRRYLK